MLGVCRHLSSLLIPDRVRAMHQYRLPAVTASYPPTREEEPLINQPEPVFDGDDELAVAEEGELIPYAHRDVKPA